MLLRFGSQFKLRIHEKKGSGSASQMANTIVWRLGLYPNKVFSSAEGRG